MLAFTTHNKLANCFFGRFANHTESRPVLQGSPLELIDDKILLQPNVFQILIGSMLFLFVLRE